MRVRTKLGRGSTATALVLDVAKFRVYTSLGKVATGGMASIGSDGRTVSVLLHTH